MRADAFFAAAEALPIGGLEDLTGGGGLVVVAPHPDDESLGCGGLIAAACGQRIPVRLVVVSDGCGSHPTSRSFPAARLRALRKEEARAAAAILGLGEDDLTFLDLPDRFVPRHGPAADRAVAVIAGAVRDCDAGAICVTWPLDPHCDHQASAALAARAGAALPGVRLWSYPVWGWSLPAAQDVGPAPCGIRLEIGAFLASKKAAIAAHESQTSGLIDDDPQGFRLDPAMVTRFMQPFEIFLSMQPSVVVS